MLQAKQHLSVYALESLSFVFLIDRSMFSTLVLVVTLLTTVSSFVKPTANAYALNCFGLHLLYVLAVEMRWQENSGVSWHL